VCDEYYGFYEPDMALTADGYQELLAGLIDYVKCSGTFDSLMGYSEGAIVAAMLLVEDARCLFAGFHCGIFLIRAPPPNTMAAGIRLGARAFDCDPPICVLVPTAHIWSDNIINPEEQETLRRISPLAPLFEHVEFSDLHLALVQLCDEGNCEAFKHNVGRYVPGAGSASSIVGTVRAIEHTIERARQQVP
jgi:hypothetical protein